MRIQFSRTLMALSLAFPMASSICIAQEKPAEVKKSVVIVSAGDEEDSTKTNEKVLEALKKAGVSDEVRETVLKQLQEAKAKAKEAKLKGESAKKEAVRRIEAIQKREESSGKKEEQQVEVIVLDGKTDVDQDGKLDGIIQERIKQRILGAENAVKGVPLPQVFRAKIAKGFGDQEKTYRIGISFTSNVSVDENGEADKYKEAEANKLVIDSVFDETPAAKAGLKAGDVVVKVNGKEIKDVSEIQGVVQKAGKEDKAISLTLDREGKEVSVEVKPAATDLSDASVMQLNMEPHDGFVFDGNALKGLSSLGEIKMQLDKLPKTGAFAFASNNDELKEELKQIKKDLEELKGLVKELIKK